MTVNEIIQEAHRIINENKETLVANFIIENPDTPIDQIEFCHCAEYDHIGNIFYRYFVRKKEELK